MGFDTSGRIIHVQNDYLPLGEMSTTPVIRLVDASAAARRALPVPLSEVEQPSRLVIVRGGKGHQGAHFAWEIRALTQTPPGRWRIYVDARSGAVVRSLNLLRMAGPPCTSCDPFVDPNCGRIFFHDPVTALDDPSVRNLTNVNAALTGCALENLTSSTQLDGNYANTSITSSRASPPYDDDRNTGQRAVDEVTVYYHLDRAHRYLEQIGFPGVMNYSIAADAHDTGLGDQSYYDPVSKELHFGEGGVDDGQDAGVIYHEYGHAIQDNEVPGFGASFEGGAMGEGFGDYWASSLRDDAAATVLGVECVAPWDATYYNPWTGVFGSGCLRRVDNPWVYPADLRFEVHADGEIWSAALWDLHQALGGTVADRLVIKAHTFLTSVSNFIDGADALLSADEALYAGAHSQEIESILVNRGLPTTGGYTPSSGMTSTAAYSCSTSHAYANEDYKECAFTVPGAARIRFHFSAFSTELEYDYVYISDAGLHQVQAMSGSIGAGYSAAVDGDTIVARFKADTSVTDYGFDIDSVSYLPGAGRVPDGGPGGGSGVQASLDPNMNLTLSWDPTCWASDVDYAVYRGALPYTTALTPVECSTGGVTTTTVSTVGPSSYYLVVATNGSAEGSYGLRSDGSERIPSGSACRPQGIALTCP